MYSVLPQTIKKADRLAQTEYGISSLTLMQRAAKSALSHIYPHINSKSVITVLCGKGNNGGDGYEIAAILSDKGYNVSVADVFSTLPASDEAKTCREHYISSRKNVILDNNTLKSQIEDSNVIIDAIFGVGFHGGIEKDSDIGKIIELANNTSSFRIAIDTPSGVNCADGTVKAVAFKADLTVTISFLKTGLMSYPARLFCGEIKCADIGFPKELVEKLDKDAVIPDESYIKEKIPKRRPDTHKGSFGKLLSFCGSPLMTGAAYLAALSALRTGAGLVTAAADTKTLSVLQNRLSETVFYDVGNLSEKGDLEKLISLCNNSSAVLIGCGLGKDTDVQSAVFEIIKKTKSKLIIDADGINMLSSNINVLREAKHMPVITPHPAEFSRLSGKSVEEIQSDRLNCARCFSKEYGCITVLKGASTVISAPDGRIAVNTTGNPGLAKGGSGDVLSGIVSSLICQGIDSFEAAVCAVYLHGKAADILKENISEYGLLPSDLPMAVAHLLP